MISNRMDDMKDLHARDDARNEYLCRWTTWERGFWVAWAATNGEGHADADADAEYR
jgi:hypothetical protein